MKGRPGSAPPLREVGDQEVRENERLVHHVLQRMRRRNQLADRVEYEDLAQIGMWGLWEALRRWQPSKGARSTYCSAYIWGYVMKHQRDITKAEGWHHKLGQIATVVSYEETIVEDFTVLDSLAAPDDTAEEAEAASRVRELRALVARMPASHRLVGERILDGLPTQSREVVEALGVSRSRVGQITDRVRARMAEAIA